MTAGGKGIESDLLFDLDEGAVGTRSVMSLLWPFTVSFGFVIGLAIFFFLGEAFDGGALSLGGNGFFDGGRQVGALDLLSPGPGQWW